VHEANNQLALFGDDIYGLSFDKSPLFQPSSFDGELRQGIRSAAVGAISDDAFACLGYSGF